MASRTADVVLIGDGIIALASALALARSGLSCVVVGRVVVGAASPASAGLLAPSLGPATQSFRTFMLASRERYPAWVNWLTDRAGSEITLNRLGIVDIAAPTTSSTPVAAEPLTRVALASLEPGIEHDGPALLFRHDGYVNNVQLLAALQSAARGEPRIEVLADRVVELDAGRTSCMITTELGQEIAGSSVVLAAGAWSASIRGLPRPIPIEPVRGQILQLQGCPLSRALSLADAYLVPRGECMLIGSTIERVGFETATTVPALERLHRAAASAVPALANAQVHSAWSGLRPMTPDGMPLLGRDPEVASVIYACGHGKNGILLAPITAECVAAVASGGESEFNLAQFSVERFESSNNSLQRS